MRTIRLLSFLCLALVIGACNVSKTAVAQTYNQTYRPQFHFSPKAHWMNDPNGMVYLNGKYHLFFQYYPEGTTWGPMYWGHAISKDLVHWEEQPIALSPDSLGYIFSGSAVVDHNNTSGLGKDGKVPLIAIFTHHNKDLESKGRNDFQYQSIAYSLDEGKTWTKYSGNPVLKNPGIVDFRDPKVMWYEEGRKWIMTLATKDRITFYSSPDLKNWERESDFGSEVGAHGGVWECPDLFPLDVNGKKTWVLLVSINPGAPNGGSGTQYFTGDFDGKTFVPHSTETKWIDYGTDNYAGVTWSNTGNRKVFIGWMNNWQYANVVPTVEWRGATTIARELSLEMVDGKAFLVSSPVKELGKITRLIHSKTSLNSGQDIDLSAKLKKLDGSFRLDVSFANKENFQVVLSNTSGEELIIGYDKDSNQCFIDRSKAGKSDFEKGFAKKHFAPRISLSEGIDLSIFFDSASAEVFLDNGLNVFTDVYFPENQMGQLKIETNDKATVSQVKLYDIKTIW